MTTPTDPTSPAMRAWRAQVEAERPGTTADKLATPLVDGFRIEALYAGPTADPGAPGVFPYTRGSRADDARWWRTQVFTPGEPIGDELVSGVNGVWLEGTHDISAVLAQLDPARTLIAVEATPHAVLDALADRSCAALILGGDDPSAELLARVEREGRGTARTLLVSTRADHQAGAHPALELGIALARAVARLRALDADGVTPPRAAPRFAFAMAVGRDVFLEIAKLRAARLLWSKVLVACGVDDPPPMWIHAETSRRTLSTRDPWVNMLRVSTATFAAAVGGADSIASLPFDHAIGAPDVLGRRVARNTSIVLAEESELGTVIDPAGGSHAIEALTLELARSAWRELQAIEGGADVSERIAQQWTGLRADIVRRKHPIVGVSEFAHPAETALVRTPRSPDAGHRDAEPFEQLRARAETFAERPRAYLATLGPLTEHAARQGFAQGVFAAGGLDVQTDDGAPTTSDLDALAQRFASSGARVACLCGTDARYAIDAADAARALIAAGASRVYLAGRPGPHEAALRAAGVHDFIFLGCDVEAMLAVLFDHLAEASSS